MDERRWTKDDCLAGTLVVPVNDLILVIPHLLRNTHDAIRNTRDELPLLRLRLRRAGERRMTNLFLYLIIVCPYALLPLCTYGLEFLCSFLRDTLHK